MDWILNLEKRELLNLIWLFTSTLFTLVSIFFGIYHYRKRTKYQETWELEKKYYQTQLNKEATEKEKAYYQNQIKISAEKLVKLEREKQDSQQKLDLSKRFSERMIHKFGNSSFLLNGILKNITLAGVNSFDEATLGSLTRATRSLQSIIWELEELNKPISTEKIKTNVLTEIQLIVEGVKTPEITIKIETREKTPVILLLNKEHFYQAIGELLQNAIKVNNNKVGIEICIQKKIESEQYLQIIIKDNGIGVLPERKKEIFDPFFSQSQGTGLGLSIVKKIIEEELGGSILETGKPQKGACFEINFPINNTEKI